MIVLLTVKKYNSIPWYYITVHTPEKKREQNPYDYIKGFSHIFSRPQGSKENVKSALKLQNQENTRDLLEG